LTGPGSHRRRLAIVPARGGSKRIPDKNIRDFNGRPIIAYSLNAASTSKMFDTIHVSTDSPRIASIVEGLGYPVEFMRDPALADDHTGLFPVAEWTVRQYRAKEIEFDDVCLLMPCAPLIEGSDIAAAMAHYDENDHKPLLAVSTYPAPVQQALRRGSDDQLSPKSDNDFKARSQDLEPLVFDTGTFLIAAGARFLGDPPISISDFFAFDLPREKAIDINDEADFFMALILHNGLKVMRQVDKP